MLNRLENIRTLLGDASFSGKDCESPDSANFGEYSANVRRIFGEHWGSDGGFPGFMRINRNSSNIRRMFGELSANFGEARRVSANFVDFQRISANVEDKS